MGGYKDVDDSSFTYDTVEVFDPFDPSPLGEKQWALLEGSQMTEARAYFAAVVAPPPQLIT